MKHLYYTNPINENYRIALERSHACDTIVDFRIFAYIWEFRFTTFYAKHAYFVFTDAYFGMFQVRIICCLLFFSVAILAI